MIAMRSDITIASSRLWVMYTKVLPVRLVQILELLLQRLAQPVIQRGERFIEEQNLGVEGQRPGQGDALLLAARALAGCAWRRSRSASAADPAIPLRARLRVRRVTPRIFSGNSMFSPTERCGNRARATETPCRSAAGWRAAFRCAGHAARSSPSVGSSMPTSSRIRVVLPLPEGPTMVRNSPFEDLQVDPVQCGEARQIA